MALICRITCSYFYGTAFAFSGSIIRLLGLILAVRLGLGSLLGGLGYKVFVELNRTVLAGGYGNKLSVYVCYEFFARFIGCVFNGRCLGGSGCSIVLFPASLFPQEINTTEIINIKSATAIIFLFIFFSFAAFAEIILAQSSFQCNTP